MEGIIKEGNDVVKKAEDEDVRDAAIISAARRVEHYEIAAYGTVRTYSQLVGEQESAQLLQQTLDEEKEADQKLTGIAENFVNAASASEGEHDEEEEEAPRRGSRRATTTRGRQVAADRKRR